MLKPRGLLLLLLASASAVRASEARDTLSVRDSLMLDSLDKVYSLKEAVVSTSRDQMEGDKRIVRFTQEQRKRAATMRELLGMQNGFNVSRGEKDALTYNGLKKIIYTVDGVEKGEGVIDMQHGRYARVEVHQFPGGKYQEYEVWVDIITDTSYMGYEGNLWATPQTRMAKNAFKQNYALGEGGYFGVQQGRWSFSLQAGDNWAKAVGDVEAEVEYKLTGIKETIAHTAETSPNSSGVGRTWYTRFSTDWRITDKSSASFVYNYDGSNNWKRAHTMMTQTTPTQPTPNRFAYDESIRDRQNTHSLALFYRNQEGRVKFNTDLNYRFTPSKSTNEQNRSTGYNENYYFSDNLRFLRYNLEAETQFVDDRLTLSAGYVATWKDYRRRDAHTHETYNTNGYLRHKAWAKAWMRWAFGLQTAASLWTEPTRTKSNGTAKQQTPPWGGSVELYIPLKNGAWTRLDYNCTVSYPDRDASQDWGYQRDSLTWVHGNPDLKGSTVHHFTYRLDLWRAFNIALGLNYEPDQICSITLPIVINGRHMVENTTRNVMWKEWWAALSLSKDLGKGFYYKADAGASLYKSRYGTYERKGHSFRFSTSINYWCKPIRTDFTLWYDLNKSANVNPQYKYDSNYECPGLEIRHKALNNRLIVALRTEFLFHFLDNTTTSTTDTPFYTLRSKDYLTRMRSHEVMLKLTYMFSGGKSVRKYNKELSNEQ